MKWPSLSSLSNLKSALPVVGKFKSLPRLKATMALVLALIPCLLLIAVWWWGPEWKLRNDYPLESLAARWLATAIIIMIVLFWIGMKAWRRLRTLEKLNLDVELKVVDPVRVDIEHQDRYLEHWKSQLHRHLDSYNYLYQRPWYMMIGSQNSGKTSLIKEGYKLSEIAAPEYLRQDGDVPLMLHCWLGEKAVIIDPKGQLIDQPVPLNSDKPQINSRLWEALLSWLTENRQRQPLNGIILTVDTLRLLTDNREQRDRYVREIHQRLQDIRLTFHSQLPLYLVMTKIDLLHGFEAMYQSLDRKLRDQILGVTFSLNNRDEKAWHSELDQFWKQWMNNLNMAMPDMMLNNVDANQRSALFSFTRQVQGLHSYVAQMLEDILYNDENHRPTLRGVYLTSAHQVGQMDDLFTQSASAQYHLGSQAYPTWPVVDTLPYFTHALFEDVLLAEPNLAAENRIWLSRNRRQLYTFSTVSALVTLALWGGWHYFYQKNYRAGEEVLAQAKNFLSVPASKEDDHYGNLQLPLLNPIRDATLAYGNYHENQSFLTEMALYQGDLVGPYVAKTYEKLLEQRFLPSLMQGLLDDLNQAPTGSEEKLEILRVMRMMEDKSKRNSGLVAQYMRERWSQAFHGQRDVQDALLTHLDYALVRTDWKKKRDEGEQEAIDRFAPFIKPIHQAQQELKTLSVKQRVYQNLRIKAQDALSAPVNLRDQIGPSFDSVFVASNEKRLEIPQFLTRHGLVDYFVPQGEGLVELTEMDSWVLNIEQNNKEKDNAVASQNRDNNTNNNQYSETDQDRIKREITELYLADYTANWRAAMNNLEVRDFEDLPQAISAIEQVISGEQPIKRALQILSDNTHPPLMSGSLSDKERQVLLAKEDYRLLNRISRDFAPETGVLVEHGDKGSTLQSVYQKLMALHRYLLAIQNSPVPGKAALQAVQMRLDKNNSDAIFEVQQMAKTLPEPLNRWVGELAEQAWRVVMMEAVRSLEVEWNDTVVKQYQTYLAGRYPFNPRATEEVPLSEFDRFFRPGGTLDAFYQQSLKPFVENNLTMGTDGKMLIRPDVMKQLEVASRIRTTFFTPQNGLGTQFAIEPVSLTGNKRRALLNLDGQLVDYSHGRSNVAHLIWPNSMRAGTESKLTLMPDKNNQAPRSISFTGPWAQLRLINNGKLTNVQPGFFDVRFSVDGGEMTYRIYVDESDNPFAGGLFSQFKLPDTLY
ncbi:type VI secretion system membrane subunit TssM [Xenorhabdus hominickii]|uniref:IcmF-like protein n=1 Tax=Xenorhabdus hominickii TaxID=351679 RepID=A0A2G0QFF8_XENHO|nr:type VI secretion system membrane subunit TssM [Xenorhabdus hominickii]AOM41984.1 type VI secretion protein IcmF [Xenorhabdus hominickii]PHM57965.1 IcmF-like protein [Xenorhabdus hominickii]